jgi:hypothetical protein
MRDKVAHEAARGIVLLEAGLRRRETYIRAVLDDLDVELANYSVALGHTEADLREPSRADLGHAGYSAQGDDER